MRIINRGSSELVITDPEFKVVEGQPIPASAQITIGLGDDIPPALWKALPVEKQEFFKTIGAVEVTDETREKPVPNESRGLDKAGSGASGGAGRNPKNPPAA